MTIKELKLYGIKLRLMFWYNIVQIEERLGKEPGTECMRNSQK